MDADAVTSGVNSRKRKLSSSPINLFNDDSTASFSTEEATKISNSLPQPGDDELSRLQHAKSISKPPIFLPNPFSKGIGKFTIPQPHATAIKQLHRALTTTLAGVAWGEGEEDPIRRMYGFLPGQRSRLLDKYGIKIQRVESTNDEEHAQATGTTASTDLVLPKHHDTGDVVGDDSPPYNRTNSNPQNNTSTMPISKGMLDALQTITKQVRALVPGPYKQFTTLENLIAVQPNLHNGAVFLPLHLDFPRCDGFGVVIVTVAVSGSGHVVLLDEGDTDEDEWKAWSFPLRSQQPPIDSTTTEAYIMCCDARNKCLHGVLCHEGSSQRETLNLRYGLHSAEFAYQEVDRHWPD